MDGPGRGLLDQQVWVDVQLFGPEQPEHHQFGAHDHTRVPPGCGNPVADVAKPLVQGTRRFVPPGHVGQAGVLRVDPFGRQARSNQSRMPAW